MKKMKYILPIFFIAIGATAFVSCSDMLDMGNDDVLYTDENTLKSANDTVNSFTGILYQLQKVAVRTNLFGELRGDLTQVYTTANANLKAIADFTMDSNNPYNNPRDYYAVINNCNYFLKNADTELTEKRYMNNSATDYHVLRAEWVAVRAIRAWLYLQLGQIYGDNIPVIEEPLLSIDDSQDAFKDTGNRHDLAWICDHFIADLEGYVDWFDYPYHGNPGRGGYSGSTPSRMSVFPIQLVLGDLCLWLSSIRGGDQSLAKKAAEYYYKYIVWVPSASGDGIINNTGYKKINYTGYDRDYWAISNGIFSTPTIRFSYNGGGSYSISWSGLGFSTPYSYSTGAGSFSSTSSDVITAIAMDSVAAAAHFNDLRFLYSLNAEDDRTPASLGPSQPCIDYSDSQIYGDYYKASNSLTASFIVRQPESLSEDFRQHHFVGDMRLGTNVWNFTDSEGSGQQVIMKSIATRDVIIYRTVDIYLRLAEALNTAGYPYFAKYILTLGLDQTVIDNLVLSQCYEKSDSLFVQQFKFPREVNGDYGFRTQLSPTATSVNSPVNSYYYIGSSTYNAAGNKVVAGFNDLSDVNQIGIHQRGSGNAYENPYYYPAEVDEIPNDVTKTKNHDLRPVQPALFVAPTSTPDAAVAFLSDLETNNAELIQQLEDEEGIAKPVLDTSVLPISQWPDAVATYRDQLRALSDKHHAAYLEAAINWQRENAYLVKDRQQEVVDSLLDIESALETCFEGFRFGFLMRADYRCGGTGRKMGGGRIYAPGQYLAERVGKRDGTLQGQLMDRNKWFFGWKDALTGATIGVQR